MIGRRVAGAIQAIEEKPWGHLVRVVARPERGDALALVRWMEDHGAGVYVTLEAPPSRLHAGPIDALEALLGACREAEYSTWADHGDPRVPFEESPELARGRSAVDAVLQVVRHAAQQDLAPDVLRRRARSALALAGAAGLEAELACSCGASFPERLGRYGCPNCHGEGKIRPARKK